VPAAEAAAVFDTLKAERHLALAVSGGSDSVAMLRLAHDCFAQTRRLSVLTVDHGLRRESGAEADWVATLCRSLGLSHRTLRWEGVKPTSGIQAKARQARYHLLTEWCKAHGAGALLTAHTLDDQAETVAMRLQRTHTALSLAGILQTMNWEGVLVHRPLLAHRRLELRAYLARIGQDWIEDPSNDDWAFERVRVRAALAGDNAPAELAAAAFRSSQATARDAEAWLAGHLKIEPQGFGVFPRQAFCRLPADTRHAALRHLITTFGRGDATPGELTRLADWIASGESTRRTLAGTVFAGRRSAVLAGREWSRIAAAAIPSTGWLIWDGRFRVSGEPGLPVLAAGRIRGMPRLSQIPRFVQDAMPVLATGEPKLASATFMACLR
jgi:tRNA(Ile)-lysidine synthase